MGLTHVKGRVRGPDGEADVRFLVDSGAMYTLLPTDACRRIGLSPSRTEAFTLADGTQIERHIAECFLSLPQGAGHSPVILGEPGDEALLGTVTLEILGLVLDPFRRELRPMRMLLA